MDCATRWTPTTAVKLASHKDLGFELNPSPAPGHRTKSMRFRKPLMIAAWLALAAWLGPGTVAASPVPQRGYASYYAQYHEGLRTASGERFHTEALTAAHRSLPFGTRVRVTNLANGRHVIVRINDRGPYVRGRMLDVSYAAARQLGMLQSGVGRIRMVVLRG